MLGCGRNLKPATTSQLGETAQLCIIQHERDIWKGLALYSSTSSDGCPQAYGMVVAKQPDLEGSDVRLMMIGADLVVFQEGERLEFPRGTVLHLRPNGVLEQLKQQWDLPCTSEARSNLSEVVERQCAEFVAALEGVTGTP